MRFIWIWTQRRDVSRVITRGASSERVLESFWGHASNVILPEKGGSVRLPDSFIKVHQNVKQVHEFLKTFSSIFWLILSSRFTLALQPRVAAASL